MKFIFLINPRAGTGKAVNFSNLINETLENTSVNYSILPANSENIHRLDPFVLREQGIDRVIAIGGDGTVNAVAKKLVYSEIPVGILPTGSGNGLARSFGIPFQFHAAMETIKSGKTIVMDAGKINGHYFFSSAGLGLDGWIANKFNNRKSKSRGMFPYYYYTLKGYFLFKPFTVDLKWFEQGKKTPLVMVTFANTPQLGGGATISPMANPCDGNLDICLLKHPSFLQAIRIVPLLFSGKIDSSSFLEIRHIKNTSFECSIPVPYHVDGEPYPPDKEFEVSIAQKALSICVPHSFKNE